MGDKRGKYVARACIRCKEKKIKCQKDGGPYCEACRSCIENGLECVQQGDAKKRGPKPQPSTAQEPHLSQNNISENVRHDVSEYQSLMIMINGDNGEYYDGWRQSSRLHETNQNGQIFSMDCRASMATFQVSIDDVSPQKKLSETFMLNGGNSNSNFYPQHWLNDDIQYIAESCKSSMAMSQKHLEQISEDPSFQKPTSENIQNGIEFIDYRP
ncbi:20468_t:CDS:2 [Dentiscutata erythropus]|uniref:20468_t:CDS:1 n=1 Tax=Dentiscutata erythropus TaxID=1348616 RepID=A0A9N9NL89_9GLOM|nr:20468_t:CDS:2 [Dentiscutata erythropus]